MPEAAALIRIRSAPAVENPKIFVPPLNNPEVVWPTPIDGVAAAPVEEIIAPVIVSPVLAT